MNTIDWDKQADEILDKSDIEKNDSDDTDSDNDNSDTQDNLSDAHKMTSRLKKVSMRLDKPKLFGLLMEVEDGFNELAVAALISSLPVKRGGSLSFLVGTISNVLVMEIGWTDVGSGGYILVSCWNKGEFMVFNVTFNYISVISWRLE
jgi:hypothetical protein